ncbi:hypothetical protein SAMN05421665_2040 [Yoonia rosea]|uniref:Uncharacterized protein n=1 Tax=Yoonia rosea TaxID=287098 RepID=A0A1R3X2Z8_9RHOB|nr:hypothetical protein SAMN05421665_2040 [Yoonia rosea]
MTVAGNNRKGSPHTWRALFMYYWRENILGGSVSGGQTAPLQAFVQTVRSTIMPLMCAIAAAGFRPLGHVFAQFMIVWQR